MTHSTLAVTDFQFLRAFRQLLPPHLLQRAVAAACPVATRDRCFPAPLLLGTLIAWFFHASAKLPFVAHWLCRRPQDLPSDSALYQARARLSWGPVRWLCRRVLRPLAEPARDPFAFYDGRRLLALDGTTFTVADTPANDKTFGRAGNQHGRSGYPLMRTVALCEVGTHALLRWLTRGYRVGEMPLAERLWRHVPAGALLLCDRNFHCFPLWQAAADGGWDLLLRVQAGPQFAVEEVLSDGSYLSRVYPRRGPHKKARAVRVRVIDYRWTDAGGAAHTARLLTSLRDAERHPASALLEVYHRRWEQEGVWREVKAALAERATQVRAQEPLRALQELDGLLLGHFVVRGVIVEAARAANVAAVAISFTGALRVLRARCGAAPAARRWWEAVLAAIGRERVQKRRPRRCPRKKKVTRSHWPIKRPGEGEAGLPTFTIVTRSAA